MKDLHLSQKRRIVRLVYYWIIMHLPAKDFEADLKVAHDAAYYTAIRLGACHRQALRWADRAARSFAHQINHNNGAMI